MNRTAWLFPVLALSLGCDNRGDARFGEPCSTGDDCNAGECVGGEATGRASFCSESCSGKKDGDACGGGRGKCVADFVSWCWVPCSTDAECTAINAERPRCVTLSSSGKPYPFKVCAAPPADAGG